MQKIGQVTIFIVIGLVILLFSAFAYYLITTGTLQKFTQEARESSAMINAKTVVSAYMETCLRDVAQQGILLLGASGGVIYPDDETKLLVTENTIITYLITDPDKRTEKMENDIAFYIMKNIDECIDDFSSIEGMTIEAEKTAIEAEANIKTTSAELYLYYPVTITLENEIGKVEEFFATAQTTVYDMTLVAETLIANLESGTLLLENEDYQITAYPFDAETMIFAITDENNLVDNAPQLLFFAAEQNPDYVPVLEYVPDITIRLGQSWTYYLKATDQNNDDLTFSSNNAEFSTTETGIINVTPSSLGTYSVIFTVADEAGNEDSQEVKITVIAPYE